MSDSTICPAICHVTGRCSSAMATHVTEQDENILQPVIRTGDLDVVDRGSFGGRGHVGHGKSGGEYVDEAEGAQSGSRIDRARLALVSKARLP